MDVRNCKSCGTLYNYVSGQPLCINCKGKLEDKFKVVRLFIRKNPQSNLTEISEKCDVEIRDIRQWIREERLSFSKDSAIGIECEGCGNNIKSGRYCTTCKDALVNGFGKHTKKPELEPVNPFARDTKSKMRFLDKDKLK